jgi:hypothetical protein
VWDRTRSLLFLFAGELYAYIRTHSLFFFIRGRKFYAWDRTHSLLFFIRERKFYACMTLLTFFFEKKKDLKCACGKRLTGKYIELGTCADYSPKKEAKEFKCTVCDSKLYTHFRELGLCSSCHKKKEKREEKAAKDAANKK